MSNRPNGYFDGWVRGLLISACLALGACGAGALTSADSIDAVRRAARDAPDDTESQRRLALGEMLLRGGAPERAREQLVRARHLLPEDEALILLSGTLADLHGHPAEALTHYLDSLEAASRSGHALAPFVAELAVTAIEDLGDATTVDDRTRGRMASLFASPGAMGFAARHTLGEVLIGLAFQDGDRQQALSYAEGTGCIREFRVAGPFGPRQVLGFDSRIPAESVGALADEYDLGPGRGVRATRDVQGVGCSVHLGDAAHPDGGTTVAEAFVEIPAVGGYWLRLETPNAVEVLVDGERAIRLDRRRAVTPRVTFHWLALEAGRHEVTVKVTTRHPNPILVLSLGEDRGNAFGEGLPEGSDLLASYLRGAVALARGNPIEARQTLRGLARGRDASPLLLQLRATVAIADPLRTDTMRRDEARRLLRFARRRDPFSWYPLLQLARLDAADGRLLQAIGTLQVAVDTWPEMATISLTLADYLVGRGWFVQADRMVARAAQAAPNACAPKQAAAAAAERQNDFQTARARIDELMRCDARSSALLSYAIRSRDWATALEELLRLEALDASMRQPVLLAIRSQIARGGGEDQELDRVLTAMARSQPTNLGTQLARVDRLLAQERPQEARRLLDEVLAEEPAALAELRLWKRALGSASALETYRLDGEDVIREFEESGRVYDGPEVLVLDYTVTRVFDDGSSMALTHNIWRVQSEAAADERGEFQPPPGAKLLTLRTVKADGQRIEPDEIEGKETISLPRVAPLDYVEYEYVELHSPTTSFPGGYLGDRFYFRSFETPYDLSQLTVLLPATMEPILDPRGDAPPTEERMENGLRVLRWTARGSRPRPEEPMSVAPREYIPSINLGVEATWPLFVENLVDSLADQDVWDPAARALVDRILGEARSASPLGRARRLYAWVLSNVEHTDDVFGLSAAMVAARSGHRARVLHYLLKLSGVPSNLFIARSMTTDGTRSVMADADTYQHLLVAVGRGSHRVFLHVRDRATPFGYLPPFLQGQEALPLSLYGRPVTLPSSPRGTERRTVRVDAQLREDGSALLRVREVFRGAQAIEWRAQLRATPQATLEQRFEESYAARLVAGASLEHLAVLGRDTLEREFTLEYELTVQNLGRREGTDWVLPGLFPAALSPAYAELGSRTTDQLIANPVDLRVELHLRLPHGARMTRDLSPTARTGPHGAMASMSSARDGDTLVIRRSVYLPTMRIVPGEYPALTDFCRGVDEDEARELTIGPFSN